MLEYFSEHFKLPYRISVADDVLFFSFVIAANYELFG